MRTRSIRNLYFRWGREYGLEPENCARILERAGLITLTGGGFHYQETAKALAIAKEDYDSTIHELLDRETKNGNV